MEPSLVVPFGFVHRIVHAHGHNTCDLFWQRIYCPPCRGMQMCFENSDIVNRKGMRFIKMSVMDVRVAAHPICIAERTSTGVTLHLILFFFIFLFNKILFSRFLSGTTMLCTIWCSVIENRGCSKIMRLRLLWLGNHLLFLNACSIPCLACPLFSKSKIRGVDCRKKGTSKLACSRYSQTYL